MPEVVRYCRRLCLLWLLVGLACAASANPASANPNEYPEYAQIKIAQDIAVEFITAEEVKQRLDASEPQMIIDVRSLKHFDNTHLPGAVSVPLRDLETRIGEIPRDTLVVFY